MPPPRLLAAFTMPPCAMVGPVAEAPPGCVTVNVRLLIAMVPVREAVVVFASAV